jgi:hypothetical protein
MQIFTNNFKTVLNLFIDLEVFITIDSNMKHAVA